MKGQRNLSKTLAKRQLNKGKQAAGGTTRSRQHTVPPTVPAKSLERQTKHGRKPVTRSVVAEASRMRRVLRTPPTNSEPDGRRPPHVIPAQAGIQRGNAALFSTVIPVLKAGVPDGPARGSPSVQDPSEWSSIRQTSFRIVGRKRLQHQREGQSSDDGSRSFTPCFPEGRRSGDVGGAGT